MNVCRWTSPVISMSHASKSLCWAGTCTDNQPPCMYLKPLIVFLLWYCNRLQAHTHTRTHTGTPPHTPSFQVDWSLNLYTISYMKRQTNSLAMKDHGVSLSMRVSQSTKGEPNNQQEERRGEEKRREEKRRRRKNIKAEKSRNTVFLRWFVAPEDPKVGSLKRRVRSHLERWEINKCTLSWRGASFEVKMHKTPQRRSTFGSWDVDKVHAVVARSTFRSQNVQSTSASEHF